MSEESPTSTICPSWKSSRILPGTERFWTGSPLFMNPPLLVRHFHTTAWRNWFQNRPINSGSPGSIGPACSEYGWSMNDRRIISAGKLSKKLDFALSKVASSRRKERVESNKKSDQIECIIFQKLVLYDSKAINTFITNWLRFSCSFKIAVESHQIAADRNRAVSTKNQKLRVVLTRRVAIALEEKSLEDLHSLVCKKKFCWKSALCCLFCNPSSATITTILLHWMFALLAITTIVLCTVVKYTISCQQY